MATKKKAKKSEPTTVRELYNETMLTPNDYLLMAVWAAESRGMTPLQTLKEFQAWCVERTVQELMGEVK
jgi:hypothetical protein